MIAVLDNPRQLDVVFDGHEQVSFRRVDAQLRGRLRRERAAGTQLALLDWLEDQAALPTTSCPLLARALRANALWLGVADIEPHEVELGRLEAFARAVRTLALNLQRRGSSQPMSFLYVLPTLTQREAHARIEDCVASLRVEFLRVGLLISALRGPVPALVVRALADADLAALERVADDDPEAALVLLDAYLERVRSERPRSPWLARGELSRARLTRALARRRLSTRPTPARLSLH